MHWCTKVTSIILLGMNETLGQRVRRLRKKAGFTQERLAALAECSSSTVARLERGESDSPDTDTLKRLATALGVSFGEVLGDGRTGEPSSYPSLTAFLQRHAGRLNIKPDEREWLCRPLPNDLDIGDDEWWMSQLFSYRQQLRAVAGGGARPEIEPPSDRPKAS